MSKKKQNWLPFHEAREFARNAKLSSVEEWRDYLKRQREGKSSVALKIPTCPNLIYTGAGWTGYGDFLGNGRLRPVGRGTARSFPEARAFVHSLGIKSISDWRGRYRFGLIPGLGPRPRDIPSCPDLTYRNKGWAGWHDFLNIPRHPTPVGFGFSTNRNYMKFAKARAYARSLKLKCTATAAPKIWATLHRNEMNIPSYPNSVYRNSGWSGWINFLGLPGPKSGAPWRSFDAAREFVSGMPVDERMKWIRWTNARSSLARSSLPRPELPQDIPLDARIVYRHRGWRTGAYFFNLPDTPATRRRWKNLFGGRRTKSPKDYLPFEKARLLMREFARSESITSHKHLVRYLREGGVLPTGIPRQPDIIYEHSGWEGWPNFIGYDFPRKWQRRAFLLNLEVPQSRP